MHPNGGLERATRRQLPWWRLASIVILPSLAALIGCREPGPRPDVVILIVADALRADRLGAYGNRRRLTPFLDSFAQHAYVFHSAYAAAPWTEPSVASLFTSRFPGQLGIESFGMALRADERTLAEELHEHGYATAAFLSHWFLVGRGLEQGFEVFTQRRTEGQPKTRGPVVNSQVFVWLDQLARREWRPIFLYLHYAETHVPYTPPPEVWQRALGRDAPNLDPINNDLVSGRKTGFNQLSADELRQVSDAYDAEVASLDDSLSGLYAGLAAAGVLENAVIVFTADHGEGFQEHGYFGHGNSLFNEVIRVPLIISVPGLTVRIDIDEPVSLMDVAPTVLDLVGIAPCHSFEGRTLTPIMRRAQMSWLRPLRRLWDRRDERDRPILSERAANFGRSVLPQHDRAVVIGSTKYIAAPGYAGEFYDLRQDPEERQVSALPAADRDTLRQAFDRLTRHIEQGATPAENVPLDATTRERMRALGYSEQ